MIEYFHIVRNKSENNLKHLDPNFLKNIAIGKAMLILQYYSVVGLRSKLMAFFLEVNRDTFENAFIVTYTSWCWKKPDDLTVKSFHLKLALN